MPTDQPTAQPVPDQSSEHRAAVVAEIRALADFVEIRTDLPVPDGAAAQYSELDKPRVNQVVHAAAAALGVEPKVHADGKGISFHYVVAERNFPDYFQVTYAVHGFLPADDTEAGEQA